MCKDLEGRPHSEDVCEVAHRREAVRLSTDPKLLHYSTGAFMMLPNLIWRHLGLKSPCACHWRKPEHTGNMTLKTLCSYHV